MLNKLQIARLKQDDFIDQVVSGHIQSTRFSKLPSPLSLHPNENVTQGAIVGSEVAREILKAWKFDAPITVMAPSDFDAMIASADTLFVGRNGDSSE